MPRKRLKALLGSVNAKVGKRIDPYFDFEAKTLNPVDAKLNEYRKTIRAILRTP